MRQNQNIHAYYQELAKDYDSDRFANTYGSYIHQQEEKFLLKYLSKNSSDSNSLNLACGTGRFMEFASDGLDFSSNMIAVAREKFLEKTFTVADASQTPFENEHFDSIFAFHLFMHLDKELCRSIFKEAQRLTKSGGRFIFDFPSAKRRKLSRRKKETWHGSTDFTLKELQNDYLDGWKVVASEGIVFLPIHRFPTGIRKKLLWLDSLLCRSIFKEYASYTVIVLEKM